MQIIQSSWTIVLGFGSLIDPLFPQLLDVRCCSLGGGGGDNFFKVASNHFRFHLDLLLNESKWQMATIVFNALSLSFFLVVVVWTTKGSGAFVCVCEPFLYWRVSMINDDGLKTCYSELRASDRIRVTASVARPTFFLSGQANVNYVIDFGSLSTRFVSLTGNLDDL